MAQQLHTDSFVRLAMTDEQLGVDPTVYTFHMFRWQGPARDFYDEGRRRVHSSGLPPQLLAEVFNRPGLRVATSRDIDDAVAWMIGERCAIAGRIALPATRATPRPREEMEQSLEWAATVARHTLRYGKPVSDTQDLDGGASRLWVCVHPRLRQEHQRAE